jgi:hypothetical protein
MLHLIYIIVTIATLPWLITAGGAAAGDTPGTPGALIGVFSEIHQTCENAGPFVFNKDNDFRFCLGLGYGDDNGGQCAYKVVSHKPLPNGYELRLKDRDEGKSHKLGVTLLKDDTIKLTLAGESATVRRCPDPPDSGDWLSKPPEPLFPTGRFAKNAAQCRSTKRIAGQHVTVTETSYQDYYKVCDLNKECEYRIEGQGPAPYRYSIALRPRTKGEPEKPEGTENSDEIEKPVDFNLYLDISKASLNSYRFYGHMMADVTMIRCPETN